MMIDGLCDNESTYLQSLKFVLENGVKKTDRTGTGTLSVFGTQQRYDLRKSFPLLTTKRMYWNGILHELLWFLKGDTNIKYLQDHNVHIWDEWANEQGELGPVYGFQWRKWQNNNAMWYEDDNGEMEVQIDQIANVVASIKKNPDSRRHVVSAWNPADLKFMRLEPCHILFQFYVANGRLSCQMYQRSADMFLGVPFNIASYSLLTHIIAKECNLEVGEFIHTIGDAHIYLNHIDQVKEQLSREIRFGPLLKIVDENWKGINNLDGEEFIIAAYSPHPSIKAPIAV